MDLKPNHFTSAAYQSVPVKDVTEDYDLSLFLLAICIGLVITYIVLVYFKFIILM